MITDSNWSDTVAPASYCEGKTPPSSIRIGSLMLNLTCWKLINKQEIQISLHLGSNVEVIHSPGAHEGQLHMCVRVDATRDHQFVGCIDHAHSRRGLEVLSDFNYFPILYVDVADHGTVLVHNFTSLNENPAGLCHCCCAPRLVVRPVEELLCAK